MLMILARLVRSESFWAVAKVRSPHTGPGISYIIWRSCARRPAAARSLSCSALACSIESPDDGPSGGWACPALWAIPAVGVR